MSDSHRLFLATAVPEDLVDRAIAYARGLGVAGARWIGSQGHLTVKFLGWVTPEGRPRVLASGAEVAARHDPAVMSLEALGAFPRPTRARVLWVGVDDPARLLSSLAADLDEALAHHGFDTETRAFTPHLTLARFKAPVRLPPLGDLPEELRRTWSCDHLLLYRSHLSPKGARYEVIDRWKLGGTVVP